MCPLEEEQAPLTAEPCLCHLVLIFNDAGNRVKECQVSPDTLGVDLDEFECNINDETIKLRKY